MDNGKITVFQLLVIVFLYTIGTTVLVIPAGLAGTAGQDAWLAALTGTLIGAVCVGLYAALWRLYPGQSFVGICETVAGRWLGDVLSAVFMLYSFIGAATVLFYVGNFFNIHFLPRTPLAVIVSLFTVIVVMGSRLGIEAIARTSELMMPWFLLLLLILVAALVPRIDTSNLHPTLESGVKPLLEGGLSFAGTAFMPIVFMFAVFPRVQPVGRAPGMMWGVTMLGGLCVALVTLLCILILGPDITMRSMYPSYVLAKKINIGNFLQRIEAVLAGLWFITTYIKTTFYFYGWVTSLSDLLRLNNYRTVTLPCGMILIIFSLIVYPDVVYMQDWDTVVFPPYILTMGLVVPLVLLMVGLWKKRGLGSG